MASPAQIAANRANAQRSTGPRTPEGKAASRLNALRHGLYAEGGMLRTQGRDPLDALSADFEAYFRADFGADFRAEFKAGLGPIGAREEALIRCIAELFWRLDRLCAIEAALLTPDDHAPDDHANKAPNKKIRGGNARIGAARGKARVPNISALDRLGRLEARLSRALDNATRMLERSHDFRRRLTRR